MPTKAELKVENWNLKYPAGTAVVVTKDDRSKVETETTSEAWIMGGSPVIKLAGIRGGYLLDRVKPIPANRDLIKALARSADLAAAAKEKEKPNVKR